MVNEGFSATAFLRKQLEDKKKAAEVVQKPTSEVLEIIEELQQVPFVAPKEKITPEDVEVKKKRGWGTTEPSLVEKNKDALLPSSIRSLEGVATQPYVILQDKINIEKGYYKIPNDISDKLSSTMTPAEEIVYNKLYRMSYGWNKNYCRVGYEFFKKKSSIKGKNTVIRAIKGLCQKRYIARIINFDGEIDTTGEGTLYRVFTPEEILNGISQEGILIKDISIMGIPKMGIPKQNKDIILDVGIPKEDIPKEGFENNGLNLGISNTGIPKEDPLYKHTLTNTNTNNNRDAAVVLDIFNKSFPRYSGSLAYKTVLELIKEYGVDSIVINLGRIKEKKRLTNPAGLLIDSLKRGWQLPPTEEEIIKEERRKIEEMGEVERKKREEEIKEIKKERKERERLEAKFKRLPQKEQEELKEKARELLREENKGISEEGLRFILSREMIVLYKTLELIKEE